MAGAILVVGLAVNLISPAKFFPLAMVGGVLWATANVTAVPIINTIGMALGILIWNTTNLLAGWASGRFGWFNTTPQKPESDFLNYLGLTFCIISGIMFAFVKNKPPGNSGTITPPHSMDTEPLISSSDNSGGNSNRFLEKCFDKSEGSKRIMAIAVALVAGVFYGLCFAPVIYIQDNYKEASKDGLPYVFAQFCGIFVTSTFYLLIYCAYKQNVPKINPRTVLPAFVSGVLWAVAQSFWFVANSKLSEAVSFPIITRFPGIVAALWGVFYFREIRGAKNLQILFWAMVITVIGGVLSGLSKVEL